eukprot:CAMPEP_0202481462 /NCGR_PEP_ID=MMETSP1361-20130828/1014_1 /ASSEMBLY_ACC=CAM_ASM_000849 /TAXON_ID=210615 /ORGANISM="Staurosira complex sp., Strain CCMP2646" /LENGTH=246 /DNA_ID=CAMNT_0049108967 /DNA_START=62 /DNA_END=802 /DNA_ORIENTATION=-
MKFAILSSIFISSVVAFAPVSQAPRASTQLYDGMADLEAIATKGNPLLKFYDPLQLSSITIFDNTNDQSIAFLRHSEIKHGRIAMAAFVGYIVQSNGIHFPWPMTTAGEPFPWAAGSPPEQWDALPNWAKLQIIIFIGFLEWFSEAAGTHYMRGGTPGAYPKFTDYPELIPHPVPFNLFDPFGFSANRSEEAKADGLIKELNNGRAAQFGILGFIAAQKVEGSVPLLKGLVPPYAGETMAPFQPFN